MEFQNIKEWLDLHISIRRQLIEAEHLNELCRPNKENTLHVYKGIDILADVVGAELLLREDLEDEEYPYYHYFMYDGFEVFQIGRERLV